MGVETGMRAPHLQILKAKLLPDCALDIENSNNRIVDKINGEKLIFKKNFFLVL